MIQSGNGRRFRSMVDSLAMEHELVDIAAAALPGQAHLNHRRVHLSRHDRVHTDVLGRIFHGGHPAKLDH